MNGESGENQMKEFLVEVKQILWELDRHEVNLTKIDSLFERIRTQLISLRLISQITHNRLIAFIYELNDVILLLQDRQQNHSAEQHPHLYFKYKIFALDIFSESFSALRSNHGISGIKLFL